MNSYKELWIEVNNELYNDFCDAGFSPNEAQRRADLLTDEYAGDRYADMIAAARQRHKDSH